MNLKFFFTTLLILTIFPMQSAKAIFESNIYKEGVYDITDTPQVKATAMLTTPDEIASLVIFDPNGNEIFYKKFDTVNEPINLGAILDDDRIAVIGKGEIAITIHQ